MSMFGPKEGSWYSSSIIDIRWNNSGRAFGLVWEAGPKELHDWINGCKERYGDPPADLRIGFIKD